MTTAKVIFAIWNKKEEAFVLYYTNHQKIPQKAFFTSQTLAEDAIECLHDNDGINRDDLEIIRFKKNQNS